MPPSQSCFDIPTNRQEITQKINEYSLKILSSTAHISPLQDSHTEDDNWIVNAATELSYADLRKHKRPVFLLSELCRLLIKHGDYKSFQRCLVLSHKIYDFNTKHNESWYVSYLYKGIAQIGMQLTDIGISKVLFVLSNQSVMELRPEDKALGYWSIMSAAIHGQNLKMAMKFALRWKCAAQEAQLTNEIYRSCLAMQILHLVYGDQEACRQGRIFLSSETSKTWNRVTTYLMQWTDALLSDACFDIAHHPPIEDPFPLLTGIEWHHSGSIDPRIDDENFSFLCHLRQNYCNAAAMENLSTCEIEFYASIVAQWELPGPLVQFEDRMREKDITIFSQFALTRVMGKHRTMLLFQKASNRSDVMLRNDGIILTMDIRRFSTMCEEYPPEKIFEIINPLFRIMNKNIENAGGAILEFVGDCIIVAFNTFPGQRSKITDILSLSVNCLRQVRIHNALSFQSEIPTLSVGLGIAQGAVAVGYVGGLSRCHLTLMGNAINLSARIESETKDSPTPILVSRACFENQDPDIWTYPDHITFSLRDLSLRPIKNMSPVYLYGVAPLLAYQIDFVPMGFVARKERGVVYIDTGNAAGFGIIDHHYADCETNSACELLLNNPQFVLGHLQNLQESEIEFRLHVFPDIDCAATLYAAFELMTPKKFHRLDVLEKIATYVGQIDQGGIPDLSHIDSSLYGIFMAHQAHMHQDHINKVNAGLEKPENVHFTLLVAGMKVIDAAAFIMERTPAAEPGSVFIHNKKWFSKERKAINKDLIFYKADLSHPESGEFPAQIRVCGTGDILRVSGLWLCNPRSILFKQWARCDPQAKGAEGYPLIVVDWSEIGKKRFVISVNPESGTDLKGLGAILEQRESEKRKALGKQRPVHPVRPPSDNSDPWYFGQGHDYTIVDSPRQGTVLTIEEIKKILENW